MSDSTDLTLYRVPTCAKYLSWDPRWEPIAPGQSREDNRVSGATLLLISSLLSRNPVFGPWYEKPYRRSRTQSLTFRIFLL